MTTPRPLFEFAQDAHSAIQEAEDGLDEVVRLCREAARAAASQGTDLSESARLIWERRATMVRDAQANLHYALRWP